MVFKFALLVMIVFLNSAIDGKYLLVKVDAEFSNKGFEAEQDNRGCLPEGCKYILSSSYILFLHCVWWQTACNYPLTHSLHGRATHRLLARIRGRFCSVPFSNILWKYICNLRLWCFYIIEHNSNVIVWFIWSDAKSCRSCVVSNLHRVPVKPSPRPCNCHNHLVFAMCSLQEALPSHCGSAERCIRRTIISPKSEYCFAL